MRLAYGLIAILLFAGTPSSARLTSLDRACICFSAALCCFFTARGALAHAPDNDQVVQRNKAILASVVAFSLANSALSFANTYVSHEASQDSKSAGEEESQKNYLAGSILAAISGALMVAGAITSIPESLHPGIANLLTASAFFTSVASFVADVSGYTKALTPESTTTDTQKLARNLSIASLLGTFVTALVHPIWFNYRFRHHLVSPA